MKYFLSVAFFNTTCLFAHVALGLYFTQKLNRFSLKIEDAIVHLERWTTDLLLWEESLIMASDNDKHDYGNS